MQADFVRRSLLAADADLSVEEVVITTRGDKILDVPLAKVGGKGLFIKEIEDALLRGDVDLAVHSLKDVPAELPAGLDLVAFPAREDPRDALVGRTAPTLAALPRGARLGTSSLRRAVQVRGLRPDIEVVSVRGNVGTRLGKLEKGEFDAILLAAAGLRRLGLAERATEWMGPEKILPAIGQGVLALEARASDEKTRALARSLHDRETERAVAAERGFLRRMGGGCQVPLAAHARSSGGVLRIDGFVANLDGTRSIAGSRDLPSTATVAELGEAGVSLAEELLGRGGAEILREIGDGIG